MEPGAAPGSGHDPAYGRMGHTGRGGYIDTKTIGADGRSYAEETAQAIVAIIDQHTPAARIPAKPELADLTA